MTWRREICKILNFCNLFRESIQINTHEMKDLKKSLEPCLIKSRFSGLAEVFTFVNLVKLFKSFHKIYYVIF